MCVRDIGDRSISAASVGFIFKRRNRRFIIIYYYFNKMYNIIIVIAARPLLAKRVVR
jgi:hypothetical protein